MDKITELPDNNDKFFTHVTKLTGAIIGAAEAAKGSVDLAEAIVFQDGVCSIVLSVGWGAGRSSCRWITDLRIFCPRA